MEPSPIDVEAMVQQAIEVSLILIGVVGPLLIFLRAATGPNNAVAVLAGVAYGFYLIQTLVTGKEVVIAGGWFCLGVAAVLLAREAYRGRLREGARTAEDNPTQRPR